MTTRRLRDNSLCVLAALALGTVTGCGALGGSGSFDTTFFGDSTARAVSGEMGGPGGMLAQRLNLTADQQVQAREIFDRMKADLQPLMEQARTDIRNLLTPEQQAKLDALPANHPGPFGGPGMGGPGMAGPGMMQGMRPGFGPQRGGAMAGGMGGMHPGMMGGGDPEADRQARFERFAEALGLTDEQKTQIQAIQESVHTAVEARRQQAFDELRAILTTEQTAILDQIEAEQP